MKVLVTGSNGFIGTATVESLLRHGERDIRCFVRPGAKYDHLEALGKRFDGAKIEIFVGNLSVSGDVEKALDGVSVLYHLAAAMKGAPADMFMSSVVHSKRMLEVIATKGKDFRVVLVSSFGVYGVSDLPKGGVVTEETPMDPHPEKRDVYSHAKVWQEKIFWEFREKYGFELVVLRPGVVYGSGGAPIASRVGMDMFGVFVSFGGNNPLPITYVDNCADAIVVAGQKAPDGEIYTVSDDDIPTCNEYLARYSREVKKQRTIKVPYFALVQLSKLVTWYVDYSEGQLPPMFTPYKVGAMWKNVGIDNSKLKALGWKQAISTDDALRRTFKMLRERAS